MRDAPPTFFALRARGMSSAEAAELSVDLVVPWLLAQSAALRGETRST